jgi:aminoglycoside 6'-N-acetyltransferase
MVRPSTPVHGRIALVRPATEADAEMLASWHADPDVSRFWDGETYTADEVLVRLRRPDVDAYIVEAAGEPLGYLQAWFGDAPEEAGLDMFLVPAARGRGVGPDAARALARHLLSEGGRSRLTVDPYLWNESAIRAWSRAGFRAVEERPPDEDHRDPWLLMAFGAE